MATRNTVRVLLLVLVIEAAVSGRSKPRRAATSAIHCWATCDLANCGDNSRVTKRHSFVNCSWTPRSSSQFTIKNATISTTHGQTPQKSCTVTPKCDAELTNCEAIFYYSDRCQLIKQSNQVIRVSHHGGKYTDFKICHIGKLHRPIMNITVLSRDRIAISDIAKPCQKRVDYRLTIYENGIRKVKLVKQTNRTAIDVIRGAEYTFMLQSTKTGVHPSDRVYSDPSPILNYVTRPATPSKLTVKCDDKNDQHIIARWEISGKADSFLVSLVNDENDEYENITNVTIFDRDQHEFELRLQIRNTSGRNYFVNVTAHNEAGYSISAIKSINQTRCNELRAISCRIEVGLTYVEVDWDSNLTENLQVAFRNEQRTLTNIIPASKRSWRQTKLQKCKDYTVTVSTDGGDDYYPLCTYTVHTEARYIPLRITLLQNHSNTVEFQVTFNVSYACSEPQTFWWKLEEVGVGTGGWTGGRCDESIWIPYLKPNTDYRIHATTNRKERSTGGGLKFRTPSAGDNYSPWSETATVMDRGSGKRSVTHVAVTSNLFIALSVFCCGILLLAAMIAVAGYFHRTRKRSSSMITKSEMHSKVESQVNDELIPRGKELMKDTEQGAFPSPIRLKLSTLLSEGT